MIFDKALKIIKNFFIKEKVENKPAEMTYQEAKKFFKSHSDKQALFLVLQNNLTVEQKNIIKAVDIDGLTLQEASDSLNISLSSLKRKRDNAYKIIAKLLQKYYI